MKIALLGMGTIGSGVYELLCDRGDISIKRILERRRIEGVEHMRTEEFEDILRDDEIDTVVELMGGISPAFDFAERALRSGKNLVSANKLMIASNFRGLIDAARVGGAQLRISASVGGGIPYLANLMRARRVDNLVEIGGIVNGTTNLILDLMQREGHGFSDVLSHAQREGYAEADPSADIDGLDAKSKLAISASTAFDLMIDPASIDVAGIRTIRSSDVEHFKRLGLICRLIAHASRQNGAVSAYVEPTLIGSCAHESAVANNDNYISFTGVRAGRQAFIGQGAGKLPTAYAVVEDLIDIASGAQNMEYVSSHTAAHAENDACEHRYYLRTEANVDLSAERIGQSAYVTEKISVSAMHAIAGRMRAEDADTFFAGIRSA